MEKDIKKPNAILFVCNINSIRSPMAEAITKEWFDQKIFVDSCGIKFGKIDYLAVEVMAEKKLNLAGHKSKLCILVCHEGFVVLHPGGPDTTPRYLRRSVGFLHIFRCHGLGP